MENEIPVAICNRTGKEQDLKYFGESAVYDAHGHQLIKLDHMSGAKTVDISINKQKDENLSYKGNRLPNAYKELSQMGEIK